MAHTKNLSSKRINKSQKNWKQNWIAQNS